MQKTNIVIAKLKNLEQVSSLTTDIDAFSNLNDGELLCIHMMIDIMIMHETRMHENYDLKWSQTWPLFFIFY